MPSPERLRDSTQIVVPCESLSGLRDTLEADFDVTVFRVGEATCRIVGSPIEIKAASDFLSRHGITLP